MKTLQDHTASMMMMDGLHPAIKIQKLVFLFLSTAVTSGPMRGTATLVIRQSTRKGYYTRKIILPAFHRSFGQSDTV